MVVVMGSVRCVGVNVHGRRCGRRARVGSGRPLCVFHRRVNRYVAPRKVRCVGRRVDGGRCGGWALKEPADGGEPLCSVHAGRSVAQGLPPDGQRCVAVGRPRAGLGDGERCRGWALVGGGGRLCSVHAGVGGWRAGEARGEWPLAEGERCVAMRVDGGRCEARGVVDGLCNVHAGRTGFEVGNEMAWKHGLYARRTAVEEMARMVFIWARVELSVHGALEPGSEDWEGAIRLCRVMLRRLLENWENGVVAKGTGVAERHARLMFEGVRVVSRVVEKAAGGGAKTLGVK